MNTMCDKNKDILISYFQNSAVKPDERKTGLELEHFAVSDTGGFFAEYFGENGIGEVFEKLKHNFNRFHYENGMLLGMANEKYALSLEPSSQLEISIMPRYSLEDIGAIYRDFLDLITPVLRESGFHLETYGYRPFGSVQNLHLIPKKRYEYMDRYFRTSGKRGINMMRGTASTQVSLDYTSEEDFVEKYRFAYLITPAVKLICDNTPVFEGKTATRPLVRTIIWRDTDPARCAPNADLFEKQFGFESYADRLMNVPLILLPREEGADYVKDKTAAELFKNRLINREEAEHIMSMVFPDVRLKSYIEIRASDALPIGEALGYAALMKGLFYAGQTPEEYLSRYPISIGDIAEAEDSLIRSGRKGIIYGTEAEKFIDELFEHSAKNLVGTERALLDSLYGFYDSNQHRQNF